MRILTVLIVALLLLPSCRSKKKISKNFMALPKQENEIVEPIELNVNEATIIVKEENVSAVDKNFSLLIEENYYVIMGSFKILDNAKRYQSELMKKGFASQLLQNEKGLYRVSVFSYIDIEEARTKVFSIRKHYPEHHDVWLLRKIK